MQAQRAFQGADCFRATIPADPQISPDGKWVAYVGTFVSTQDAWENCIRLVRVETLETTDLGEGDSPRWSNEGSMLAFVSRSPQGFALKTCVPASAASCATLVAEFTTKPSGICWSPDDQRIAFTMQEPSAATVSFSYTPTWNGMRGSDWAPEPVVSSELVRRSDGSQEDLPDNRHQIFLCDVETGLIKQLTHGVGDKGGPRTRVSKFQLSGNPVWMANGRSLIIAMAEVNEDLAESSRASGISSDLYEIDGSTGNQRRLLTIGGPICCPRVAPNGDWIAFTGLQDAKKAFQKNSVFLYSILTGLVKSFSHPREQEIHPEIRWAPDSAALYLLSPEKGAGTLSGMDLLGNWETLYFQVGGSGATGYAMLCDRNFSVSAAGQIALLAGADDRTDEIVVLDPQSKRHTTISQESKWLKGKTICQPKVFQVCIHAHETEAVLLKPDGVESAPVILWLHGGPYHAWCSDLALVPQIWASHGFAVVMLNPRGSLGYGEKYTDALQNDFPGADDLELIQVIEKIVQDEALDDRRMYVAGESGGATLASWLIAHSNKFAASALLFGVYDWTSLVLTADRADYYSRYWVASPPYVDEGKDEYYRRSTLYKAANVKTPALVVCGDCDWRTPFYQSEMYFTALKLQGVETALVRFPGGCHGLDDRPSRLVSSAEVVVEWFRRFEIRESRQINQNIRNPS